MIGSIETWDPARSLGTVRGVDGKAYRIHYTDFEEYKRRKKRITMEIGQDVTFTPAESNATNVQYDSRSALFQFSFFRNFEKSIADLANNHAVFEKWSSSNFVEDKQLGLIKEKAETEDWHSREREKLIKRSQNPYEDYVTSNVDERIRKAVTRKKYEVLFSFLERTFERLQMENKIIESESGAVFNTALGNKFNKDVFAVFKKNEKDASTPYEFDKFADENFVGRTFPDIPEPPDYFYDIEKKDRVPSDNLILDTKRKLFADNTHLFDERRSRFPKSWEGFSDVECAANFGNMLEITQARVRRNFRAAVPFYYPGLRKIQMLLPVTFSPGTDQEETHALVVARVGAGYSIETIMPLDWAYKNARLLAKPDREDWLDF